MTPLEEARSLVSHTVLYSSGYNEPEEVVITEVNSLTVEISWPGGERREVSSGYLMPLPGEGADPLTAVQGRLNDFAVAVIRATQGGLRTGQGRPQRAARTQLGGRAGVRGCPAAQNVA